MALKQALTEKEQLNVNQGEKSDLKRERLSHEKSIKKNFKNKIILLQNYDMKGIYMSRCMVI